MPLAANATAVSKDECREFMSVFPGKLIKYYVIDQSQFQPLISLLNIDLVRDLTEKAKKYDSKDASKWLARVSDLFKSEIYLKEIINVYIHFKKALQYNVPCGKKNRGLATVLAFKTLATDEGQLTPENIRLAHYLGWCVEMVCTTKKLFFILPQKT